MLSASENGGKMLASRREVREEERISAISSGFKALPEEKHLSPCY